MIDSCVDAVNEGTFVLIPSVASRSGVEVTRARKRHVTCKDEHSPKDEECDPLQQMVCQEGFDALMLQRRKALSSTRRG